MGSKGFVAYPAGTPLIQDAILGAVELSKKRSISLHPWEQMRVIGFKIDDAVRSHLRSTNVLIADITYPNTNVYYEIGYAIAIGKAVAPIINSGIDKAAQRVSRIGIFDNIGWVTYSNGVELSEKLEQWQEISWTNSYTRRRNHSQPLFILDALIKTDFRNYIFNAAENSNVKYRSFDPAEVPRLTAAQAVGEISSSAGVILPFISHEIVDNENHNLRAAFLLGLAHGYEVEALAIQYGNGPAPLDYREFITNSTYRHETEVHVTKFANEVLIWNQKSVTRDDKTALGLLNQIYFGSPAAENETQRLSEYFVETAEFARAIRAESALIVGRKGSGKSAVYFQAAEKFARDRRSCVVDLRPASHNLSEMREAILGVVTAGVFDHTIAAFWQYILYVEIILKLREIALPKARNDFALQTRIRNLEDEFSLSDSVVAGDFTARLATAVKQVLSEVEKSEKPSDFKTNITNALFEKPIPKLREAISSFNDIADQIIVLIDDLDKGWPPRRVEPHDISMIKHLIEALNRLRRDLDRKRISLRHLVFLRSDIYEQLVAETSDRGKYNPIKVDWSDPDQLRNLLRQRVFNDIDPAMREAAWTAINPDLKGGDAISTLIDSSLRRPRFLIDICDRVLSCAINRGHSFVVPEDIEEGLRQMSLYLVSDFGYEMRDVAGTPEDIFYAFIGKSELLTQQDLDDILQTVTADLPTKEIADLLLWYGFLGINDESGKAIFIYDRAYDFRRLLAERQSLGNDVIYVLNPAFLRGLRRS